MAQERIQVPDNVFRVTPASRRTIFTTQQNEERIRLGRDDREARLKLRTLRREEAGSSFRQELEKIDGEMGIRDCLLRMLASQENTSQDLSGEANSSDGRANYRGEVGNLEKMKRETVEALKMLM
ncbi:hypothetical protein ACHAP3_006157 [Botrytis cinerea]